MQTVSFMKEGRRYDVPCGRCVNCLSNKRADWSFRLNQELERSSTAFFITLTYSDDNITENGDGYGCLVKRDVQLFLKRLRRTFDMKVKELHSEVLKVAENENKRPKIRYFLVGEYGTKTNRPHYHGIFYNLPQNCEATIESTWAMGNIHFGRVTPASIHYVTKYCINMYEEYQDKTKPFAIMSLKPALGSNYLDTAGWYHKKLKSSITILPGGIKQKIPRYYTDKIFNRKEKEKLAIENKKIVDNSIVQRQEKLLKRGDSFGMDEIMSKVQRTDYVKRIAKKGNL